MHKAHHHNLALGRWAAQRQPYRGWSQTQSLLHSTAYGHVTVSFTVKGNHKHLIAHCEGQIHPMSWYTQRAKPSASLSQLNPVSNCSFTCPHPTNTKVSSRCSDCFSAILSFPSPGNRYFKRLIRS